MEVIVEALANHDGWPQPRHFFGSKPPHETERVVVVAKKLLMAQPAGFN
jgi:hypothetical protein